MSANLKKKEKLLKPKEIQKSKKNEDIYTLEWLEPVTFFLTAIT